MSASFDAWPFVLAAYAVTVIGTGGLFGWALAALRSAERRAAALDRRQEGVPE